jgi:hypothetical protein
MSESVFSAVSLPLQRAMDRRDRVITLAFLRLAPDDDDGLNRLTVCVSRHKFCHVELIFDGGVSFSIQAGRTAGLRARTLSNPHYELVPLLVSGRAYRLCFQFCVSASRNDLGFDSRGMYCSFFRLGASCGCCCDRPSDAVGATFCSKIIVEALQHGGVSEADRLVPSSTTPSRLYEAVSGSDRRICDSVRVQCPGGLQLLAHPLSVMPPDAVQSMMTLR